MHLSRLAAAEFAPFGITDLAVQLLPASIHASPAGSAGAQENLILLPGGQSVVFGGGTAWHEISLADDKLGSHLPGGVIPLPLHQTECSREPSPGSALAAIGPDPVNWSGGSANFGTYIRV
jgi:hypothetical protein